MIIKVCGMTDAGNISDVAALGADWIGMIFRPESDRYVRQTPTHAGIIPDRSPMPDVFGGAARAGVFADDSSQNIITRMVNFGLGIIQFDGDETPVMLENIRRTVIPDICPGVRFVKTIRVGTATDVAGYKAYEDCVDYFLFDTGCDAAFDSWRVFCQTVLDEYDGKRPFLLGGNAVNGDAELIAGLRHPQMAGIDIGCGFEAETGKKDIDALGRFIRRLRD